MGCLSGPRNSFRDFEFRFGTIRKVAHGSFAIYECCRPMRTNHCPMEWRCWDTSRLFVAASSLACCWPGQDWTRLAREAGSNGEKGVRINTSAKVIPADTCPFSICHWSRRNANRLYNPRGGGEGAGSDRVNALGVQMRPRS
jgi:hypothetical protein